MSRRLRVDPRMWQMEEIALLSVEARLMLLAVGTFSDYAQRFRWRPEDRLALAKHSGWVWSEAALEELFEAGLIVIDGEMASINFSFGHRRRLISRWEAIRSEVFERDGYTCTYCGATEGLHCDHVFPKSRGGSDEKDNLTTACGACNMSKGSKTIEEWRQ